MAIKISSEFTSALNRKAASVEAARKAENTMSTCKMPVGWHGQAVCVGAEAGKTKDKKDDKGQVVEGKTFVRLDFNVINDQQFSGAKCSRIWFVYEDHKNSMEDRFAWCLNGMENLGLPRTLRENYKEFEECLEYFTNSDEVFDIEVAATTYSTDGKEVKFSRGSVIVDNSTSMVPETVKAGFSVEVGQNIKFMGKDGWEVTSVDGTDVTIKSMSSGKERSVSLEDLAEENS
jgi:hypothetical protein